MADNCPKYYGYAGSGMPMDQAIERDALAQLLDESIGTGRWDPDEVAAKIQREGWRKTPPATSAQDAALRARLRAIRDDFAELHPDGPMYPLWRAINLALALVVDEGDEDA